MTFQAQALLISSQVKASQGALDGVLFHDLVTLSDRIYQTEDHVEILHFGSCFGFLNDGRGEEWGLTEFLIQMNNQVAASAEAVSDFPAAGHFWHDLGQLFHRQGNHAEAINCFQKSVQSYEQTDLFLPILESRFMLALCFRALGRVARARQVLEQVIAESTDTLWRANPLICLAWLERDDGNLPQAISLFQQSVSLIQKMEGDHILLLGQTLVDLADAYQRCGRWEESQNTFTDAIDLLESQPVIQYRQIARTKIKWAKLLRRRGNWDEAIKMLQEADLVLKSIGFYELHIQVHLEMARIATRRLQFLKVYRHVQWVRCYSRALPGNPVRDRVARLFSQISNKMQKHAKLSTR